MWLTPPPGANRALAGYTVTFTKPDGTTIVIGPFNSYVADGTAYFEFVPNEVGNWTLQLSFPGDYMPAGNYLLGVMNASNPTATISGGYSALGTYPSTYFEPATSQVWKFVVQQQQVMSWPPSAVPGPGQYWSFPIQPANREWSAIAGNYPWSYYNAADKNDGPYITGPTSAHVVWTRIGVAAGLDGGEGGNLGTYTGGGTPSLIYQERAYQTWNEPGVGNVAACYNLQTGQIYYQIPVASGGVTPTAISYVYPTTSVVGGTQALTYTVDLLAISGGFLLKIDPISGLVTTNVSIAPCTTGIFYNDLYALSLQTSGKLTEPAVS